MTRTITISTADGDFSAYVATPEQLPAPSVVVIQEIFGVNNDIRLTCDELAAQGFIAVAPDLFWRLEPGVVLDSLTPEEWQKAFGLYQAFDRDKGVADIAATLDAAAKLDGATGKVGVMGFCLGGLMTYLVAVRHKVDAAVAWHGGDTDSYLDEAKNLTAPLLMHLADEDEFIDEAAQARITKALAQVPGATVFGYPGQKHAFARHSGAHYDEASATLAKGRTYAFLHEHLDAPKAG